VLPRLRAVWVARDRDGDDLAVRRHGVRAVGGGEVAAGPARRAVAAAVLLERESVGARAAVDPIRSGASDEHVVAPASQNAVGACPAVDPVGPGGAEQPVGARRPVDRRRAGRRDDDDDRSSHEDEGAAHAALTLPDAPLRLADVRAGRRLSQAISEGDGISLLAVVDDPSAVRAAEEAGAEGIVVTGAPAALREATELPILWTSDRIEAADGADACVVDAEGLEDDDDGRFEELFADGARAGLEWVVAVADEDELRLALDRLDPEILLLSARSAREDEALEHVLGLLPDVPAGKLAIAELAVRSREEIVELERAGVDAVVVRAEDVARLAGDLQPQP
jgi:hypothetical protein